MGWKDASFDLSAARALVRGLDGISGVARVARDVLTFSKNLAAIFSGLDVLEGSPTAEALFTGAQEALNLGNLDFSGYLLHIPIRRTERRPTGAPNVVISSLSDLPKLATVRGRPPGGANGNYALYHAFVESLYDLQDLNRPSLDPDAYTGAVFLVYGGQSYVDVVDTLVALGTLAGPSLNLPPDLNTLPVPQDVKARIAPPARGRTPDGYVMVDIGDAESDKAAVITFKRDPPRLNLDFFGVSTGMFLEEWSLYVKKGSRMGSADDLSALKVHTQPIPYANAPSANAVYAGYVAGAYLEGLDPDEPYYVGVGYTVTVKDVATGVSKTLRDSLQLLSGQQRLRMRNRNVPTKFTRGIPPDWTKFGALYDILPGVRDAVASARAQVEALQPLDLRVAGSSDAVDAAESLVRSVEELATLTSEKLEAATRASAALRGGLYVTSVGGKGGEALLIKEIGDQLLNENVDNQPPFKNGDSVVGALCFCGQFQTEASKDAFIAALTTLFQGDTSPESDAITALTPDEPLTDPADPASPSAVQLDTLGVDDSPC